MYYRSIWTNAGNCGETEADKIFLLTEKKRHIIIKKGIIVTLTVRV